MYWYIINTFNFSFFPSGSHLKKVTEKLKKNFELIYFWSVISIKRSLKARWLNASILNLVAWVQSASLNLNFIHAL